MSPRYYTGFGSRRMPCHRFPLCRAIARGLEAGGWTLRSGGAEGADLAFESGVQSDDAKQIFLPDDPLPAEAFALAQQHHPAWQRLNGYGRRCHARNSLQVLGADLRTPSEFGVCWTLSAAKVGGSAQAIRLMRAHDIPVYNIADQKQLEKFLQDHLPAPLDLAST